jgi:hypothetical protein
MRGSGFPQPAIDEALRQAVEPIRERLKTLCKAAEGEAAADPAHADQVARRLLDQARPLLAIVDCLLPSRNPTRDGAHDEVALCALTCEIAFGNKTENWKVFLELLERTLPLAAGESARTRIEENIRVVKENIEVGTCWFCGKAPTHDSASINVNMYGDVRTEFTGMGTRTTWKYGSVRVPRCATCKRIHAFRGLNGLLSFFSGLAMSGAFIFSIAFLSALMGIAGPTDFVAFFAVLASLGVVGGSVALIYKVTSRTLITRYNAFLVFTAHIVYAICVVLLLGPPGALVPPGVRALLLLIVGAAGLAVAWQIAKANTTAGLLPKRERASREYPAVKKRLAEGWKFGTKPA